MRALSIGLIKGKIDGIGQNACITWVQPRHMDLEQVMHLGSQLDSWAER